MLKDLKTDNGLSLPSDIWRCCRFSLFRGGLLLIALALHFHILTLLSNTIHELKATFANWPSKSKLSVVFASSLQLPSAFIDLTILPVTNKNTTISTKFITTFTVFLVIRPCSAVYVVGFLIPICAFTIHLIILPFALICVTAGEGHFTETRSDTVFVVAFVTSFLGRTFVIFSRFHPHVHSLSLLNSLCVKGAFESAAVRVSDASSPSPHYPVSFLRGAIWCIQIFNLAACLFVVSHCSRCF
mmetsp:Transcript_76977/g.166543  ORF Transcript_76977/g.166543 Transcript_76977/m.166543 type:complete len:243 (+) Transcript_76977:117-845(+)